jgi:hypothetical protein
MLGKKWGKEIFIARFILFKEKGSSILFYFWGQYSSFHMKQNVKI